VRAGRYADAEIVLRKSFELRRAGLRPKLADAIRAMGNLGRLSTLRSRYAEADRMLREALARQGGGGCETVSRWRDVGAPSLPTTWWRWGASDDADQWLRKALAGIEPTGSRVFATHRSHAHSLLREDAAARASFTPTPSSKHAMRCRGSVRRSRRTNRARSKSLTT